MAHVIWIMKFTKRKLLRDAHSIINYLRVMSSLFLGVMRKKNGQRRIIHLLVVKNPKYVDLALIAVSSFLRHNPNSFFLIHTDDITTLQSHRSFWILEKIGLARVDPIFQSGLKEWQELKLRIIHELSGTSEIFMDADLRWHGRCPELVGVTFFVKEFDLLTKEPFSEISKMIAKDMHSCYMKNTSFVSFSGIKIQQEVFEDIWLAYFNFQNYLIGRNTGEISDLMRLREQFLLSYFIREKNIQISYLKETDSIKDGQFVESSYFGTTGATF